ncbi:MAG: hypothetical protein WD894_10255 [Pirellulales bacterium]
MSKRPPLSRSAKRQSKPPARRVEAPEATDPRPSSVTQPELPPSIRQRVILAIAAGALAAWLTLLAIVAFAT